MERLCFLDPLFKTELWALTNAAAGKQVEVKLRDSSPAPEDFIARLQTASDFLGLERINIFYRAELATFGVGKGSIRILSWDQEPSTIAFSEFSEEDTTSVIDGRDILDRAAEMLDTVDEGDDELTEQIFTEEDDNDSYGFKPRALGA